MLQRVLFGNEITGTALANLGFTLLRVFTGIGLMTHGIGKVPPGEQFIGGVEKLGFPLPIVFAWAAGLAEFAGGALIALGLLTRPASFFALFTMLVAAFGVHLNDPFARKEMALLYGFLALCFMLAGGGEWSIDALLRSKTGAKSRSKKK